MDRRMRVIGITGNIGMGKSTVLSLLTQSGHKVWSADAAVHRLWQSTTIRRAIHTLFPDKEFSDINRHTLRDMIVNDTSKRLQVERILYPPLAKDRQRFLARARCLKQRVVFLEIPLLFEKKLQALCDEVWVVVTPDYLWAKRLQRRAVSLDWARRMRAHQMPMHQQKKKADLVLQNGLSRAYLRQQITKRLMLLTPLENSDA